MPRVYRFSPARLRAARKDADLTSEDVAAAIGCSWRTVLNYEAGRTPCPADYVGRFASLVQKVPADFYIRARLSA